MTILGSSIKGDSKSPSSLYRQMFLLCLILFALLYKKKSMIANSHFLMINVGYENDKCLELVSFWRAVRLNNLNASQFALANKCG